MPPPTSRLVKGLHNRCGRTGLRGKEGHHSKVGGLGVQPGSVVSNGYIHSVVPIETGYQNGHTVTNPYGGCVTACCPTTPLDDSLGAYTGLGKTLRFFCNTFRFKRRPRAPPHTAVLAPQGASAAQARANARMEHPFVWNSKKTWMQQ